MKKRKVKRNFLGKIGSFFVFAFVIVVFIGAYGQYIAAQNIVAKQNDMKQKIALEQKKTDEIKKDLEYYKSDAFIEKTAREKLGFIKQNEVLFVERNDN